MSKKKFTDGLENIFQPDPQEVEGRGTAFLKDPFEPEEKSDSESKPRRSAGRKNFTTDLDTLLEEALQETFDEQMQQTSGGAKAKVFHKQVHRKRPVSGLDMLIRRTVEASAMDVEEERDGKKRLTVTFEKKKLEKLKKIARLEKAYLKDILGDIVAEFIQKYEIQKGEVEDDAQ